MAGFVEHDNFPGGWPAKGVEWLVLVCFRIRRSVIVFIDLSGGEFIGSWQTQLGSKGDSLKAVDLILFAREDETRRLNGEP